MKINVQPNTQGKPPFAQVVIIMLILCAASIVGFVFHALQLPEANIAIVYLLAVLFASLRVPGYGYGFFTSVLSAFAFNFLFTEPYFTFTAHAPSYIITFIIMTITAFATGSLASHAKMSERSAQESEAETKALYTLTNRLSGASGMHEIASIAADAISNAICKNAVCLCFDETGTPEEAQGESRLDTAFCDWPIYGSEAILGIIRLPLENAQHLSKAQIHLLSVMIENIALAMDRFRSAQQRIKLREETQQERYRSNLLRSISHDLRTPLAGILGTTEMLFDMTDRQDSRYALIEGIDRDAAWLFSLVENVLSLTRLQDDALSIRKQPEVAEEVLSGAVGHISRRYPQYDIEAHAPEELLLIPMDAKLINQVLINLLDNAIKHTQPPGEISVTVTRDTASRQAVFSIRDNGSGIAEADLPHVFQMFYTANGGRSDSQSGIGLGLAICDSIVKAHGGAVTARNRTDAQGAEFIFTLPLEEE